MASLHSECETLDAAAFRHFSPLLAACQEYALDSGCRFRRDAFSSFPEEARLPLQAIVSEYGTRLLDGEEGLVGELESAFRLVTIESIRSAMLMSMRELNMSPPSPRPENVEDDDCRYDDIDAELPVIAQRLYNDEVRRLLDPDGAMTYLHRRALTASFLMDFAHEVGARIPLVDDTLQPTLQGFFSRVFEWQEQQGLQESPRVKDAFFNGLGSGVVSDELRRYASQWWDENAATVKKHGGLLALSTLGIAGVALSVLMSQNRSRKKLLK